MTKYAILQISDLHITKFQTEESKRVIESRMEEENYSRLFTTTLKELQRDLNIDIRNIIVSGDLANRSVAMEYKLVTKFFNEIISEIKLKNSDFFIVPGNHDINRIRLEDKYEEYIAQHGDIQPYKLHKDKLSTFKSFYDDFYSSTDETFDSEKAIFTKKYISELNLIILGINSVHRESFLKEDHIGYIDYEILKSDLIEIDSKYNNCFKVAVFHHSPQILAGQNEGVIKNWSTIQELFNEYNVSVYLYGHTHASLRESKTKTGTKKYEYVGCGSFALCDSHIGNFFNLYILEATDENTMKFKLDTYRFQSGYEERFNLGKWEVDKDKSGEVEVVRKYIPVDTKEPMVCENGLEQINVSEGLFSEQETDEEIEQLLQEQTNDIIISSRTLNDFSDKLMEIVKNKRLFKSGHFHWGKSSKAHGWLDTNSLLSDYECLKLAINSLLYLIKENNIKADLIIGIGMEGNLLASAISVVLGTKYTYIPVTNRESCDFEKKFGGDKRKSVLMITDTVFSGGTVKQIIDDHNEFFKSIDKINLVSIFYTGIIIKELNKMSNFIYKYICNGIKISSCLNNNRESCPVYINKLDTVYEL